LEAHRGREREREREGEEERFVKAEPMAKPIGGPWDMLIGKLGKPQAGTSRRQVSQNPSNR